MLSLGNLSSQVRGSNTTLLHSLLHFPSKSIPFSKNTKTHVFFKKTRTGLCSNAIKTHKNQNFNIPEMVEDDEFLEDDEFEDDELFEDEDGFGDEDEVDEVDIPLKSMKKWLENRPLGFGEGKVYDTSIEDKLMEEIEQSRKAQLANLNKLKNSPVKPSSKKEKSPPKKASAPIQQGFRVRLVNLPKKKNIHRDLRLAFEGVPGILDIVPVVSGNEKTRDPVCKGIAFVDFKSENEAYRFVDNFSGRSISFGKVQKNIKCEIMNTKTSKPSDHGLAIKTKHPPVKAVLCLDKDSNDVIDTDIPSFESRDESISTEHDDEEESHVAELYEDDEEFEAASSATDFDSLDELEEGEESVTSPSSSKQGRKVKKNKGKVVESKRRKEKIPKLNIPGSAKRLKVREKELLNGVFSKYGSSSNSSVKEESKR